jgi:hypothetical protein
MIWFIFALLRLVGAPHQAMIDWLSSPVSMVLMVLLIVAARDRGSDRDH